MSLRRFPHLHKSPGHADPLKLILNALPPGAAREFERLLAQQHERDELFTTNHALQAAPSSGPRDTLRAQAYTTGGGRRRPRHAPSE